MGAVKKQALALIRSLPDDCTWDEVSYRLYARREIEAGLADLAAGRVLSHEEVKRRSEKWRKSPGRNGRRRISKKSTST